ncbi:MAG: NYN domain-containing protein [Anaerolineae bacterium]|nr:NYN domain-containing protein [Anaerolineae bacterium]
MHYIIDGHNLIGKMPDISLKDPNDEVKLALRIKSWVAESNKRQVTLFFDGGTMGSSLNRMSGHNLKVIFAPSGKTADSLIINHMRQLKKPNGYTLVTSDREIIGHAKSLRIRSLLSEEFIERMGFVFKEMPEKAPKVEQVVKPDKPDASKISEAEVQEWLDLFGPVPERAKAKTRQPKTAKSQPLAAKKKPPTLRVAKTDNEDKLDQDEIDLWLSLFGSDDNDSGD